MVWSSYLLALIVVRSSAESPTQSPSAAPHTQVPTPASHIPAPTLAPNMPPVTLAPQAYTTTTPPIYGVHSATATFAPVSGRIVNDGATPHSPAYTTTSTPPYATVDTLDDGENRTTNTTRVDTPTKDISNWQLLYRVPSFKTLELLLRPLQEMRMPWQQDVLTGFVGASLQLYCWGVLQLWQWQARMFH